ncbi:hypothetical protein JQ628_05005 [Bradyrhizobium lablabi]|nr:hypothetical protein [Bradyrhizobium lablabi]
MRLFEKRLDMRTPRGRRFKDLIDIYSDAVGSTLTEVQRMLIRDLAMLQCLSEQLQATFIEADTIAQEDLTQYSRLSTNIKTNLKRLGLLSVKPQADDDDVEDPLEYMRRGGSRKRAKLDDDEEDD